MQSAEFNEIIEAQMIRSKGMLQSKNAAYNPEADKLAGFKKAANLQGVNMRQALLGMLTKHTVSIADMIASGKDYPQEVWDEKITDAINYHLLLTAVVWEEKNEAAGEWTDEDIHRNDAAVLPESSSYVADFTNLLQSQGYKYASSPISGRKVVAAYLREDGDHDPYMEVTYNDGEQGSWFKTPVDWNEGSN